MVRWVMHLVLFFEKHYCGPFSCLAISRQYRDTTRKTRGFKQTLRSHNINTSPISKSLFIHSENLYMVNVFRPS